MANKVFINADHIVECQVVGDQTVESIRAMGKQIQQLLDQTKVQKLPLLILDDLTKMQKVPPEGRKAVVALVKTMPYDRLAMLGSNQLVRVGANLIFRASRKGDKVQYFTTRTKAIAWLLAKQ